MNDCRYCVVLLWGAVSSICRLCLCQYVSCQHLGLSGYILSAKLFSFHVFSKKFLSKKKRSFMFQNNFGFHVRYDWICVCVCVCVLLLVLTVHSPYNISTACIFICIPQWMLFADSFLDSDVRQMRTSIAVPGPSILSPISQSWQRLVSEVLFASSPSPRCSVSRSAASLSPHCSTSS